MVPVTQYERLKFVKQMYHMSCGAPVLLASIKSIPFDYIFKQFKELFSGHCTHRLISHFDKSPSFIFLLAILTQLFVPSLNSAAEVELLAHSV